MDASSFSTVVDEAMMLADGQRPRERAKARFAFEPELDVQASKAAKKPVFKMTEFVYITCPGAATTERFRANDQHRQRFAREYHWFHDTEKEPTTGTPIETWNAIPKAKAAELKWAGIKTVEELARWDLNSRPLNSENAALVALAQDYLDNVTEKDREISALQAKIEEMQAQLCGLQGGEVKRGPGRPRKEQIDHDPALDGTRGG